MIRRHSLGQVESYEIGSAELGDYAQRLARWPVVYVSVQETGKNQVSPAAAYRWEVVCEMVDEGDGTAVGEWLIRSARLSTEILDTDPSP